MMTDNAHADSEVFLILESGDTGIRGAEQRSFF